MDIVDLIIGDLEIEYSFSLRPLPRDFGAVNLMPALKYRLGCVVLGASDF
jgi:hypothetical protein